MKRIGFIMLLWALLTACEDKLDITPKGMTVLGKVDELETLLNQSYGFGAVTDLGIVCNECYSSFENAATALSVPNTLKYAYLAYDETVDRAALTKTDGTYAAIYQYVNYMNILLDKLDGAEGDGAKKVRLAAEARVMRAYLHWLAVNIYARQYDEATAGTAGGVAYVTDLDVTGKKTKLSVAEVYRLILEDCAKEQIECLSDATPDVCRGGKAWGYAVRAKVLMQMKKYPEALDCALKSIEYQNTLEDRSVVVSSGIWSLLDRAPNNILFMRSGSAPFGEILSRETARLFEEGDYVRYYAVMGGGGGDDEEDEDYGEEEDGEDWGDEDWSDEGGEGDRSDENWSDEEGGWEDDEEGGWGDIPVDPNPMGIWNSMYGLMLGGIEGGLMNFSLVTTVNAYGITVDRMYYTAAECYIRTGEIDKGLHWVDEVRRRRIHPDFFTAYEGTVHTEEEAMALLQPAKWIECISTYENFFDCKRWNTEAKYRRTITREVPGSGTYTLAPDSPLWVFPFPNNAVRYNASLTQNY